MNGVNESWGRDVGELLRIAKEKYVRGRHAWTDVISLLLYRSKRAFVIHLRPKSNLLLFSNLDALHASDAVPNTVGDPDG